MNILTRFLRGRPDRDVAAPLYAAVVAEGRARDWYVEGGVPDSVDGRFDAIAAVLALVLIRLEREPDRRLPALLAEAFVDDMDGQLRQIGVGDVIVGKHVGRMMGALGGRITAYREALAAEGDEALMAALVRNLYRGDAPAPAGLDHVVRRIRKLAAGLDRSDARDLTAGRLPPR